MKDLSSPIELAETDQIITNQAYLGILRDCGMTSFEACWRSSGGETIKEIKTRSVIRIKVQQRAGQRIFYLKRHQREFVGFKRLAALFFPNRFLPHGRKEFQNIRDFRRSGLPTVSPVAAGDRYHGFFWAESFIITEDFHPFRPLEALLMGRTDFFSGSAAKTKREALIKEISALARSMHKVGFIHRDFNATHILTYYEKETDTPKIAMFDLQRVNQRKFFRFRWMIKSLARVNVSFPDALFNEEERIQLLLNYKCKDKLSVLDRLEWFYIKKKTARIKRHTRKTQAGRERGEDDGSLDGYRD
jgi:hypothetical protein